MKNFRLFAAVLLFALLGMPTGRLWPYWSVARAASVAQEQPTPTPVPQGEPAPPQPVVEPELQAQFLAEQQAGYMIQFRAQPDFSLAYQLDWEARGRFVVNLLQMNAEQSQQRVRAYLDARGVSYEAFWINNSILVNSSDQETFNGLLNFVEIDSLRARRQPQLIEPEVNLPVAVVPTIEPNIAHVGADQVWALGYDGSGIVVANIDTGVNYTHPALVGSYRGNMGDGTFDHNYNWWDPALGGSDPVPNDWHGHGSHTMGVMVGSDGIGMAPGAQWIACQAFEGNDSELLECGQFLLAPWDLNHQNPDPAKRPHIINNSWGDCNQYLDTWYKGMVDAWLAAGIYPVFSIGNNVACGYDSPPGLNTVGNPARYANVTAVGSTGTADGQYAPHSNWGPTDDPDIINPGDYPNLKPQVVAPGVNIRSADRTGDGYRLMSGTSMSAPHVSGLVALMWDAAPCLIGEYAATETILQNTAVPIPYDDGTGEGLHTPNYATGWGEINALAAVQAAKLYCGADFRVDAAPDTVEVCAPEEAHFDVNVVPLSGFAEPINLGVAGLPEGATPALDVNPVSPPGSAVLTVSGTDGIPAGRYDFEVVGTAGALVHSDTVTLLVDSGKPLAPTLLSPSDGSLDQPITPVFSWTAVPQADYYRLEIATDAAFSNVVFSAETTETSYTLTQWLLNEGEYYWRVSSGNRCGLSAEVQAAFQTGAPVDVVLVDDDDNRPDVRAAYTQALDALGLNYVVWDTSNTDDEPSAEQLARYDVVIWFTGDSWKAATGPGAEGEVALSAWLDGGGCLLFSGQDYLWNRGVNDFVRHYLGVDSFTSDLAQTTASGVGTPFTDLGPYALQYPFYNFSDGLTPTAQAYPALEGDKGTLAVALDSGAFKSSFWAFPFEAIADAGARQQLLQRFLAWCSSAPQQTQNHIFLPLIER